MRALDENFFVLVGLVEIQLASPAKILWTGVVVRTMKEARRRY